MAIASYTTDLVTINILDSDATPVAVGEPTGSTAGTTPAQNADAVWSAPVSTMTDKTTIGGYIKKVLLTIPAFLGLK